MQHHCIYTLGVLYGAKLFSRISQVVFSIHLECAIVLFTCTRTSIISLCTHSEFYMGLSCLVQCHTCVFSIHLKCAIVLIYTQNNVFN